MPHVMHYFSKFFWHTQPFLLLDFSNNFTMNVSSIYTFKSTRVFYLLHIARIEYLIIISKNSVLKDLNTPYLTLLVFTYIMFLTFRTLYE